jgi:hypothetical protein
MKKLIYSQLIFLKLVFGVLREYQSYFYNQIELLDQNKMIINDNIGWDPPPFENQLCVMDDVLNYTFKEYRKDNDF